MTITRRISCWLAYAICIGVFSANAIAQELTKELELRTNDFITAFNSGQIQHLESHIRNNWTQDLEEEQITSIAEQMLQFKEELGSLDGVHIKRINKRILHVTARGDLQGAWRTFQFRIDQDDEQRLRLSFISTALEPYALPETAIEDSETLQWLEERIASLAAEQPFYGVVSIVKDGDILFETASGLANADDSVTNTVTTRFNTASGSKMFTAVAIGQLVANGTLELSDQLLEHLPYLSEHDGFAGVTLEDLIRHRSGIGDWWDDQFEQSGNMLSHSDFLPHIIRNTPAGSRGEYAYSNSNFTLLGLVIEAVTNQDYYDYVHQNVIASANMESSGFPVLMGPMPLGYARPYTPDYSTGVITLGRHLPVETGLRGSAAGGAFVTSGDMHRFGNALLSGELMPLELVDQFTRSGSGAEQAYAKGFIERNREGVRSFGHGGTGPGAQFFYENYPDLGLSVLVASNFDTIAANELYQAIDQIIRENR